MYAPEKTKGYKKKKEKKRLSVEDGIPEIPRINHFLVKDCLESSCPTNEAINAAVSELASDIKQFDLEGIKNEEEKKIIDETNSVIDIEGLPNRCQNFLQEADVSSQENVECREIFRSEEPDSNESRQNYFSKSEAKNSELCFDYVAENSENESLKINDYYNLATKVKTCIKEINEPSAPTAERNIIALHASVKHFSCEKLSNTEQPIDFRKFNFSLVIQDLLPAFTDAKLSEYYYNPELNESKSYITEFIHQEINNETKRDNELYKLLAEYLQIKNKLRVSEAKINDLREKLNTCISALWSIWNDVKVTEKEKCSDGNIVTFVEKYTQAQFNADIFKEFTSIFSQIKQETYEIYRTDSFTCSVLRLKIEYFLQSLLTSCPEFTNSEGESSTQLESLSLNSHFQQCLLDLKIAISVLFMFQRKQSLDIGSSFLKETKQWLSDLVTVLLRVGNWKDHLFLLHHIMRCPGGVGEWAAHFVQLPFSKTFADPFKNLELNHMMTVMSILLSPIEQREYFIKKWESELTGDANPWTVIDSDGEVEDEDQHSCPLKENDLVSLLNQIPFGHLFKTLLKYDGVGIASKYVTFDYMLKLFSFLTDFIKILLNGLQLYSTQRYRQFTKRLGRLIYHIVQYATEALIIIKAQNLSDSEMMQIQVEYDNFFLRSTKFIYSAKKHGAWQFLATIPYHMPSSNAILKLYGILQLNDSENDSYVKVDFSKFVENFLLLPEEEQFYLLTTFANMALARDLTEIQFIKNVLLQLLFIGFLNPSTMDHCYKNVRSLVCSICSSHPFLMSEIVCIQKNTFLFDPDNDQKLSLDLWTKLPVDIWQPKKKDLETLSAWLLEPINNVRNELARLILQSLNYGMNNRGELFIPVDDQHAIAHMVLQANSKLIFGNEAGVIKNVSNLVLYQSPDQSIHDWTWNVLLKLRLHLLDKSDAEMCRCFYNLSDHLQNIPDVETNIELQHSVLKKYPVACYVALMTTTLGHSVPIICDKGFELVEILFSLGKYEPGLACLEHMTLLFLDCIDSLQKCEEFTSLLSHLITADNSYVQFAKNLISYNFPGPVLKYTESMMQNQLNRWRGLNFTNFSNVVQLWLLSLTRLPLWTQEPGVLYLIDKLLGNSFFDGVSAKTVSAILKDLLEAQTPPSETRSFSSFVGWMNSKYSPPSLLPKGFNGDVPWFSYHVIQMEYETYEKINSLWIELLKELYSSSDKKVNVDNSLKKVCNLLRIPVRSSSVLAIYKWSYQILETDSSHPLIPLIWQRFFFLYFYRVPGLTDRGSIGEKFFDGVINQGLLKRLKYRLQETCDHFRNLSENSEEGKGREHFLKCFKLFQTFSVWLCDSNLHKSCLSLHMLPVQYNPELLGLLIHGSETPWIEYLEYQYIEKNFKNLSLTWLKLKNRMGSKNRNKIISHKKEKSPEEKLSERLNSYENPLQPPRFDTKKYSFPRVNFDVMINADKMILFVKPLLQVLLDYMKHYTNMVNEHLSLGCDIQELLPRLYITTESQKILKGHCNGVNKVVNGKNAFFSCSGPAIVKLTYQESKLNEQVNQQLILCEKAFGQNLEKAMTHIPENLIFAAVLIDIAIEKLKREYHLWTKRGNGDKIVSDLKGTGVHLFYELVLTWCERISYMPPLERAFENYVEALGKCFIKDNVDENDRILHLMLSDKLFGEKVCKYFTPNSSPTFDFIANYSKVLDFLSDQKFIILSKFDLGLWLSKKKPKFSERSRMIAIVGQGLKSLKGSIEDRNLLKLLNKHLEILLMHDFPEHYGEILNFLLEASENQSILTSTWFTFLNALTSGHFVFAEGRTDKNIFEPGQSVKKLKHYFSKFAADQNLISFDVIKGTMTLLASIFKAERLKTGTRGLYRKYHLYIEPIFIFFGMLSYSSVTKAVEIDTGSLSDKLAQQLWPLISDLYSPWLVPYWVENHKEENFQEQNFDHCVLLPWVINDSCHASFGASILAEAIRFLFDALPGLNNVLSYAWYFYVTNFAHVYVKDYILNVMHDSLIVIPWENFFPSLQDVELMLKVVDQFLPLSHSFLGSIFMNVKWTELVHYYLSVCDVETTTKLHICLLHLLVKLPLEPSLKQNEKVLALLTEANGYSWHLVDSFSYEAVLNWFIMSCDPRIILMDERLEYYKLDSTILKLFQVSAGYVPFVKLFHPTTLSKRLMFVRTCVKWLIISNRRFKSKDSPLFKTALNTLWYDMETVISETVPPNQRIEEAGILLCEFLMIFTEPDLCCIVEATLSDWLSAQKSQVIVFGLLGAAGNSIENPNIFGSIIESSLENYFSNTENCDWGEVTNSFVMFSKSKLEGRLEKVLIDNNYFLTLYAVLLKKHFRREADFNANVVLTDLLQLFMEVKTNPDTEPKLILLIMFGLKLTENEIKSDVKEGTLYLVKFSDALNNFINDKGNGFLSAIGLKKSGSSNRFKLVCLVACSGIGVFLKKNHSELADEKVLQALELAENNKIYQNIQQYASYAKTAVKEITTIEQIVNFLKHIGFKLFNKLYLK